MNEDTAALDAGQAQQVQMMRELAASGVAIGGWKLGQTSGGSRDAFGPGYRAFGFVRADRVLHSGASLQLAQMQPGGIETEAAFLLDADLGAGTDAAAARAAVRIAPGFELNQSRMPAGSTPAQRIADNLSNWGIVVGEPVPVPPQWQPDALQVSISNESGFHEVVAASGHIDDHFDSIALLANKLSAYGLRLRQGDWVITGAFGRVRDPAAGPWHGDFGGIGRVTINIER